MKLVRPIRPAAALAAASPRRLPPAPPDLRQLLLRQGREDRHPAGLALPGGRATRRSRRSSTRSSPPSRRPTTGTKVNVEYIPVETRAQRIKAAFNDPKSAPDLIEYGNTDTAGYVKDGGLADVTKEFGDWSEAKDTDPTAKQSVTVDGKIYGAPFFVGVRALYYRTDVFKELGLEVPEDPGRVDRHRQDDPRRRSPTCTGSSSAAPTPTARCRSSGPTAARLAEGKGGSYASAIDSAAAQKGIEAYTSLFGDDNCPAAKCAGMGGNDTVTAFAAGKAGMAIGGDFSHAAIEAGKVKGKYAVVPLPGVKSGSSRPRVRGRQQHRRPEEHLAPHPRRRPDGAAGVEEDAGRTLRRDGLPADVHRRTAEVAAEGAVRRSPSCKTLGAGTKFVPASPAWAPDRRLAGAADDVPGGRQRQEGRGGGLGGRGEEDERRVRLRRVT